MRRLPQAARSMIDSRGAGDRRAARHSANRNIARARIRVATPTNRATERTTSQSYRRTPTSIATYSVSRNPEIIAPPESPRCEVHAGPAPTRICRQEGTHNVRSVTSAVRDCVQLSHQHADSPAKLHHPINGTSLLPIEFLHLKQLRFRHERRQRIVDRMSKR